MLKRIGDNDNLDKNLDKVSVTIGDADFNALFPGGLEYSAPVRGVWNIVHVGMLMPEAHEVFVCGASCLRGVVLTAAEMNAIDRFSTVCIREENLFDGSLEDLIVDGVSDVIAKLNPKPRVIQVYTNCIHHFAGIDFDNVYDRLEERNPDTMFMRCYMNPIMRKSGLAPDPLMRKQLYSLLKKDVKDEKLIALIGNDYRLSEASELRELIGKSDYRLIEIHDTKTVSEYQEMAKASHYITTYLPAVPAGKSIEARIGGTHHHLPISYDYDEIKAELKEIEKILFNDDKDHLDYEAKRHECEELLSKAREAVGEMPIAIDYTVAPRPLSIAKLLLDSGFKVERIYADSFTKEEESAFRYLKENYPNLEIIAVSRYEMRYVKEENADRFLALGQKAAFFTNTRHFVNEVLGSGHYGYEAIRALAQDMITAINTLSDMQNIVTVKGWGCEEEVCGRQQV